MSSPGWRSSLAAMIGCAACRRHWVPLLPVPRSPPSAHALSNVKAYSLGAKKPTTHKTEMRSSLLLLPAFSGRFSFQRRSTDLKNVYAVRWRLAFGWQVSLFECVEADAWSRSCHILARVVEFFPLRGCVFGVLWLIHPPWLAEGASLSARMTLTFDRKRQPFGCVYSARLPHSAAVTQVLPGCQLWRCCTVGVTAPVSLARLWPFVFWSRSTQVPGFPMWKKNNCEKDANVILILRCRKTR